MHIHLLPLHIFKEFYWNNLLEAREDIYFDEEEPSKEDLEQFDDAIVIFALDKKNKLLGFSVWVMCKEPRSKYFYGTNLWLWVDASARSTIIAGRLIKESEKYAKDFGAKFFKWDINIDSALNKALNKRKEYVKESIVYSKCLDIES